MTMARASPQTQETDDLTLRDVTQEDLATFFVHQLDPEAQRMAAFAAGDPTDRDAYMAKWTRILAEEHMPIKAIVVDGEVAGKVFCWKDEELGVPEVSYWIAREQWGKGIATRALSQFLDHITARPLYGRAAADNIGSIRVLEKCGFRRIDSHRAFAAARGEEIEELVLELRTP
jgi:RimJ/RimL family protein N-acetyltransferase